MYNVGNQHNNERANINQYFGMILILGVGGGDWLYQEFFSQEKKAYCPVHTEIGFIKKNCFLRKEGLFPSAYVVCIIQFNYKPQSSDLPEDGCGTNINYSSICFPQNITIASVIHESFHIQHSFCDVSLFHKLHRCCFAA